MFGVGPEELVLILIIALIVLGPERMPKVARDIGRVPTNGTAPSIEGETPFDREMREARERLRAQRDA